MILHDLLHSVTHLQVIASLEKVGQQASGVIFRQACKQAGKQACRQAGMQPGRQAV